MSGHLQTVTANNLCLLKMTADEAEQQTNENRKYITYQLSHTESYY